MANSSDLYSYQGQEPSVLPHRITLSDGRSRTDSSTFTEEELNDVGITGPYEIPQYDSKTQRMHWNSETLSYVIEDKTDEELWEPIRRERNRLLAESDWTMTADVPGQINLPEWAKYRQRLRDIPNYYDDPKKVVFPIKPSEQKTFDVEPTIELRLRWRIEDLEEELKNLKYRIFKPFPSWSWNEENQKWESPISPPSNYDGKNYIWSEIDQEWKLFSEIQKLNTVSTNYNL
jgi:hypothetical protein